MILRVKHILNQEYTINENDVRLQSIQIGAEQQGVFFNWAQPSNKVLEFKLGLPIFNEEQSSIDKDVL